MHSLLSEATISESNDQDVIYFISDVFWWVSGIHLRSTGR